MDSSISAMSTGFVPVFHRISSRCDPLWPQWKAIYDSSFDIGERMSDAYLLRAIEEGATSDGRDSHISAMQIAEEPGQVAGIAMHEVATSIGVGYLAYLATRANLRNMGLGRPAYAWVAQQCHAAGAMLMIFEVEKPSVAEARGLTDGELARRRIAWYRRQGALMLEGIHYVQSVDTGVPPIEMRLMVHPLQTVSAERAYATARSFFGDAVEQSGPIHLV